MTKIVAEDALSTAVSKSTLMGLMVDVTPDQNKVYQLGGTKKYYKLRTAQGAATFEGNRLLAFIPGNKYTKAFIDLAFPTATLTSITPATGAAAGGTATVIKGKNLGGATGVTFGGTAGTAFSIVSDEQINVTTPAKTAGAYNVVVADDSGNATLTNGFTYT